MRKVLASFAKFWIGGIATALAWSTLNCSASPETNGTPLAIVLVAPQSVTVAMLSQWKAEGFRAVAVVLEEQTEETAYRDLERRVSEAGLDLYWWIEVARNLKLATAHPRWMAALGMHDDWQKNFPNLPKPKVGEVAKAFPWVPIGYREAFEAHLARIEQLLKRVPSGWRGLLLNDLQAGPSSCGCGNLQCRWAIDYRVRPTATKVEGDDVAARFLSEVRKLVGERDVVPVWTTECEEIDLPADKHQGRSGTGHCGTVGCATATCPDVFTRQWSALVSSHSGPIGLLGIHTALERTQPQFGGGPGWVTNAINYLERTVPAKDGQRFPASRLWVIIDGSEPVSETNARKAAAKAGVGAVIVARSKINQSYEPRLIPVQ